MTENPEQGSEDHPHAAENDETAVVSPVGAGSEDHPAQLSEQIAAAEAEALKDVPLPVSAAPDNPLRVLEALLFASDEILTTERIKAIVPGQPDARKIRQMVEKLNVQLAGERHPFEIVEIGGGYQFRTVSYYYPWMVQLFKEKSQRKLSIQSLECLAIISYKQPITKAEIESIRGLISDGAMKTLLERRLITISGRSDKPGRPLLYTTTREFLEYFGINKVADLPRIEEFEALAKEKLGDLTDAELATAEVQRGSEGQTGPADEPSGGDTVAISQDEAPGDAAPGEKTQ